MEDFTITVRVNISIDMEKLLNEKGGVFEMIKNGDLDINNASMDMVNTRTGYVVAENLEITEEVMKMYSKKGEVE